MSGMRPTAGQRGIVWENTANSTSQDNGSSQSVTTYANDFHRVRSAQARWVGRCWLIGLPLNLRQHPNENQDMPTAPARPLLSCWLRGAVMAILGGILWLMIAGSAQAQNCYSSGSTGIKFGTVNSATSTDAQGTANVTCQGAYGQVTYVRWCMFIQEGSPIAGINPRWLTNNNNAQMSYGLYSDPARSQIIGAPPAGGGFSVYTGTFDVSDNSSASKDIPIYGRVPANQSLPAGQFQSQINGSEFRWAASAGTYPATCASGAKTGTATFYLGVNATMSNACTVSVSASNIDFGSQSSTATDILGHNTISVTCPPTTAYQVGLSPSNGNTGGAGVMTGTGSNTDKVPYQLHSGSTAGPIWGNTGTSTSVGNGVTGTGSGSLTAYAVAPSANYKPDTYTDTVTVTVNY